MVAPLFLSLLSFALVVFPTIVIGDLSCHNHEARENHEDHQATPVSLPSRCGRLPLFLSFKQCYSIMIIPGLGLRVSDDWVGIWYLLEFLYGATISQVGMVNLAESVESCFNLIRGCRRRQLKHVVVVCLRVENHLQRLLAFLLGREYSYLRSKEGPLLMFEMKQNSVWWTFWFKRDYII